VASLTVAGSGTGQGRTGTGLENAIGKLNNLIKQQLVKSLKII